MGGGVFRKQESFTLCTPIPGFVPRQLALDVLHNHGEVINLNPLVTDHKKIAPPAYATAEEFACIWYEITEKIQYIPGLGKMGAGSINFTGCFHDMPWGLQTHTYAPMNINLRNTYRVAGHLPGVEPHEPQELGLAAKGAPPEGLYLRADIGIECSVGLVSFVRSQTKAAIKEMVARMIKRAEEMDAEALNALLESEKHELDSSWQQPMPHDIPQDAPPQYHQYQQSPPQQHHQPAQQYEQQPQQYEQQPRHYEQAPQQYQPVPHQYEQPSKEYNPHPQQYQQPQYPYQETHPAYMNDKAHGTSF